MHVGSATNQKSLNHPETQKMSWTVNPSSPSTAWTKILGGAVKHYKKSAMVAPTAEAWKNIGAFVDAAMCNQVMDEDVWIWVLPVFVKQSHQVRGTSKYLMRLISTPYCIYNLMDCNMQSVASLLLGYCLSWFPSIVAHVTALDLLGV